MSLLFLQIFKYAGVPVDFEEIDIDPNSESNDDLEFAINSIRRNGVALKGNIETRSKEIGVMSRNVALRNHLDLYVNALHCVSYPTIPSRQKHIDIVIIRQNTEGEYAMLEHESVSGVVESMKVITRSNSERVARYAFEYARRNNRKKVKQKNFKFLFVEINNDTSFNHFTGHSHSQSKHYEIVRWTFLRNFSNCC